MSNQKYKIGEIARKTGVTVRTLRYYDEIGLLVPSGRMHSGYRLYGAEELERLQKILSLKQLGFQLEEIKYCLEDHDEYNLENILHRQIKQFSVQMEQQKQLYNRLQQLVDHLQSANKISIDNLFKTIKAMKMYEKYYSKEQLETLKQRREELGEEGMKQAQQDWEKLINRVKTEMEKGTDPTSSKVQKIAAQWQSLIEDFTGGDPDIRQSLDNMYQNEGREKASHGYWDKEMGEYLARAIEGKNK